MRFSTLLEPGNIQEDGGKGYNLKFLKQKGLNVPDAIILKASYYSENFPQPPAFDYEREEQLHEQCRSFREKICGQSFDGAFFEELRKFLDKYPEDIRYAVRSSSTFEDLAGSAFAGQHETFLNVPKGDVPEKIKECLASLWQPHAVLYRHHRGFSQDDASMAVVIQCMIPADVAGVAFAVDPVSGVMKHVLVEANYGVGESVVGGESQTDSWIVDTADWKIVERRIAEKGSKIVAGHSGVLRMEISGDQRKTACLTDEQITQVSQQARKLMELYRAPQDIEWALKGGVLYLLQARPQTTIPPRYTRDESAERFPEPLTPLTWSYVKEAFNHSLEYSLKLMNINLPTRPWFELKGYYIYGNQNAVELLGMHRPIQSRSFDQLVKEIPEIREKYQWVKDLPNRWMRDLDLYLIRVGRLNSQDFKRFNCEDFLNYFEELFKVADEYFKPNIAISMTQAFLTKTLFAIVSILSKNEAEAHDLFKKVIAVTETKTNQINKELYSLAMYVKNNKQLLLAMGEGAKSFLKKIGGDAEFENRFKGFLESYGHREIGFDYYKPTWAQSPEVVIDLIYLAATAKNIDDPSKKERMLRNEQLQATQELYNRTPKELHFFLHELVRLTLSFTFLDDLEHFQTTRINLLARRSIGMFGEKIKELTPELDSPYDLFFLTRKEIDEIRKFQIPKNLLTLIKERKKDFEKACAQEPSWDLQASTTAEDKNPAALKGTPGSPGEATGAVYIVRGVEDFSGMPDGAVLVARTTNPAWTALFYKAKAIITESGGPLSHGAVTARELGLPAVMSVKNCLSLLKNGETVSVNGQSGTIIRKEG